MIIRLRLPVIVSATGVICLSLWAGEASAQKRMSRGPGGPMVVQGIPPVMPAQMPPGGQPGSPPSDTPAATPGDAKPADGATPAGAGVTVTRKDRPKPTANPDELKARPGDDGKVQFNFHGQPWPEVLLWLAEISKLNFDWQELPGDYLNLSTQQAYTVAETRDLINSRLLERGYTVLQTGETLTAVNIKKLDPSLVPRVQPEELADRLPYEFVKVSFRLKWMLAENAVEEVKPLLSPNGKLTPMKSTNRIEAIDAVINLQDIYDILREEQSPQGQEQLVREFELQHVRAADIAPMLYDLLGLDRPRYLSSGGGGGGGMMDPNAMQMMQQMMQQMQQQMQQQQAQGGGKGGPPQKVQLIINARKNSIVAHAPSDKIAVIEQAIERLDVEGSSDQSLLRNVNRMQVYRLATIDPEPIVQVLEELGNLDPATTLKIDKKNRSIIAYATLVDHVTIRSLVEKLDGSGRQFEVIKLRRLEAEYVAGTIEFMMGLGEEKKNNNQGRNRYYDFMPFGLMGGGQDEGDNGKFRVDADIENNRLLLFANPIELDEINNLLVKLGEIPSPDGNADTTRVLEIGDPDAARKLLEQLQRISPTVVPNPLRTTIPPAALPEVRDSSADEPAEIQPAGRERPAAPPRNAASVNKPASRGGRILRNGRPASPFAAATAPPAATEDESGLEVELVNESVDEEQPADEQPAEEEVPPVTRNPRNSRGQARSAPPPVEIQVSPNGQLILSSPDTQALDLLEDLAVQMTPPRRDYKVFHLKNRNTWAYGVVLNLEKFFGVDKDGKNGGVEYNPYFGFMPSRGTRDDGTRSLSKRRPLRFISDSDSHTVLVTGADPVQLKVIEELINVYDRPEETDASAMRQTQVFQIKHSKARVIADAIKEVYRDLLSTNDPALQKKDDKQQNQSERSYTYIYGSSADGEEEPETPIKFKGLLSLGIDELSNTLVVSAQAGLLDNVAQLIDALDQAASPTVSTFQVVQVAPGVEASILQERLMKLLKSRNPQPQQQPGQPGQPGQPQQPGQVPNQGAVQAVSE